MHTHEEQQGVSWRSDLQSSGMHSTRFSSKSLNLEPQANGVLLSNSLLSVRSAVTCLPNSMPTPLDAKRVSVMAMFVWFLATTPNAVLKVKVDLDTTAFPAASNRPFVEVVMMSWSRTTVAFTSLTSTDTLVLSFSWVLSIKTVPGPRTEIPVLKPLREKSFNNWWEWEGGGYELDECVFDNELLARIELDTTEPGAQSINVQPTDYDHVIWARSNDKSIRSGYKYTANDALAIDRNRLGDQQIPEASRVQTVDFASSSSFSDSSCKCLAGRSPAAWIGIIPFEDTRRIRENIL